MALGLNGLDQTGVNLRDDRLNSIFQEVIGKVDEVVTRTLKPRVVQGDEQAARQARCHCLSG